MLNAVKNKSFLKIIMFIFCWTSFKLWKNIDKKFRKNKYIVAALRKAYLIQVHSVQTETAIKHDHITKIVETLFISINHSFWFSNKYFRILGRASNFFWITPLQSFGSFSLVRYYI
jgi:hypothetical protein